jgi:hypothetical protein
VEAWAAEVAALEAIYGDDLSHEEGGIDAAGLEAAAEAAAAGAAGGLALEQVTLERAGPGAGRAGGCVRSPRVAMLTLPWL